MEENGHLRVRVDEREGIFWLLLASSLGVPNHLMIQESNFRNRMPAGIRFLKRIDKESRRYMKILRAGLRAVLRDEEDSCVQDDGPQLLRLTGLADMISKDTIE